jgi:two-component system CheB/CheR fusion protein
MPDRKPPSLGDEEIREREQLYRELVEQAGEGIWLTDVEGRVFEVNDSACRMLGYSRQELLAIQVGDLSHPEDWANRPIVLREMEAGNTAISTRRMRRKDGVYIWVEGTGRMLKDGRTLTITRDITERVRLERELERRMSELAEADRQKDQFLAMLSHELRNPLAPILHAIDIIDRIDPDKERIGKPLAVIGRQVRHMARLLNDLLDISRITHGKIELRKELVDFGLAATLAADGCRSMMDARGHRFSISVPGEPVPLYADPTRLEQIVWNLLANAAKYTPSRGQVDLSVKREGAFGVLRVRDTGRGIPPEMLASIFELFTQVRGDGTAAEEGLGVGLTMVRKIVELHGGSVEARSEGMGLGAEIIVRLPLDEREAVSPAAPEPPSFEVAKGLRVLVVDDNEDGAEALSALIELWGHASTFVHSGEEGLIEAARLRPDVVLLDIGMPGISGYEVAEQLRKSPLLRDTLLVAMTGYGRDEDRRRALAAGFDHHLTKPVSPDDLQALLRDRASDLREGS